MTKVELIAAVANDANLTKKDAEAAVNSALNAITAALKDGDKVTLVGFGIAIVPDHPVLRCMDLKIIPLTDPDPGRTAYLCRKRGALQPTAAQRVFAFCQAQLCQGASL